MDRYKLNFKLVFIGSLTFGALTVLQVQGAVKGSPGSEHRQAWCKSKMDNCVKDANNDCDDTYFSGSTESALCKSSEVKTCKDSYGSSSDCLSRDLISRGSRKTEAASGQKIIVAPKSSSNSPKNRFKNKALVTLPISRKITKDSAKKRRFISSLKMSNASRMKSPAGSSNVAITVDDCTFYGGTVQKDRSCGTNQSCIIGNNNGCITKAAK